MLRGGMEIEARLAQTARGSPASFSLSVKQASMATEVQSLRKTWRWKNFARSPSNFPLFPSLPSTLALRSPKSRRTTRKP